MAKNTGGAARSVPRDVATAVAAAFGVTLVASLGVFPFALESLAILSPLGTFALSAIFPLLCDIYVARRFFSRRGRASRNALLISGALFSVVFAYLIWGAFVIAVSG